MLNPEAAKQYIEMEEPRPSENAAERDSTLREMIREAMREGMEETPEDDGND